MNNVVLWKQVFLGASLFLCGASPAMATEVGDLTPDVRGNALQQDGRRVTCTISDKAGPIVGANVLVKGQLSEIFPIWTDVSYLMVYRIMPIGGILHWLCNSRDLSEE